MKMTDDLPEGVRYGRVTLAHPAPAPGEGAPYMDDLLALPDGWVLFGWQAVEPSQSDDPPEAYADADAIAEDLIAALTQWRESIREMGPEDDTAKAACDFHDEIGYISVAMEAEDFDSAIARVGRTAEDAYDDEEATK